MAEPHSTDRLVRELTRLYGQAYQYTLERLADIIRQRRSSDYHRAVLAAIQGRLQELREQTRRWVLGGAGEPGRVAAAWQDGAQSAAIDFAGAGRPLSDRFVSPPRDAIEITARNLLVSLDDAVRSTGQKAQAWITAAGILAQMDTAGPLGPGGFPLIGRRIDDVLRRAGLEATARKLTEGLAVRDMRKILLSDLVQQGLAGFTDQAGRRWTLPAYAEMVARTTSREAYTQGTLQVIRRTGHDLVRASTHWPTCPICAPRQGRVYSLSGRTPGWPSLADVGPTPWHPACGHSLSPFIPELADPDELARLRDASTRPFDADPRSRAEVEAYNRSQRINTLRRERRQLLAQRKEDLVPLDAHMRRWSEELQQPDLDPVRRRELQEKLAERAERWEQGRRQRLREVNAELRDLNREQRAAFRRRQGRPLPVGGGGGGRSRRPLPGRRELARMSSADQRVQAIIEANLPDAQKLTALRSVRRAEVAQAPRDYIQATLQRAQGEKPIYRGSYHYRKHAPKFGLPVRQTITNQDVDSLRKVLAEVRTHPDDVYTYYHDKSGRRQWLFVQRRPDGKSWAVVWDEGDDRDMSGWVYPTRQEYKNDVRLHRHWLKVR